MANSPKPQSANSATKNTKKGKEGSEPRRSVGRPRSDSSRNAILDATRRLMTHLSIRELSMEGIAKKAGVGKTTLYRWWPDKVAIVIEAYSGQMDIHMPAPLNDTPPQDLTRQLERLIRQLRGKNGKIIADLLATAQGDAQIQARFNEFYMDSRRNALLQTITDGQKSGDFSEELHTGTAVDIVLGPIILRLLSGENAMDDHFAEHYPEMALHILSPRNKGAGTTTHHMPTADLPVSAVEQENERKQKPAKAPKPEIDPIMQRQQSLF